MHKLYFISLFVLSIVIAIGGIALFGRLTDINPEVGVFIGEIFFTAGLVGWVWLFVPVFKKRLTVTMLSIGSMIIFGTAFGVAGIVPGGFVFVASLMTILPNQAPPSDVL